MNTPKARKILTEIALDCGNEIVAGQIRDVIEKHLHKRQYQKPVARTRQVKITSELVEAILAANKESPHLHNRIIGRHYGVDGGRVSEIIQGDRTVEWPEGTPEFRNRYK